MGYFFALLTILFFGSWPVPTKTLKIDPIVQSFWLTVGHCILSLSIFLFVIEPISISQMVFPFIGGVLWAIGITAGYVAIKHLGISRAVAVWMPVIIIVSVLWGLVYFGEITALSVQKLILNFVAVVCLISAAVTVVLSTKTEQKSLNVPIGVFAAITLGIFHGSFFVPMRVSALPVFVTFVPFTVGMVLTMTFFVLYKRISVIYELKAVARMLLSGLLVGAGNYTAVLTTNYLGVAQGYPLTQMAIIVNTLWGMFFFKEVTTRSGKVFIAFSICVALLGVLILNFSRA